MQSGSQTTVATSTPEQLVSTKKAILFVAIFILAYMTNAFDRQIFGMLLPWISKAYNFDLKTGGSLATMSSLGLCLGGIPTGYLIDRWNRKSTLLIGMVIYGVSTLLTIFAFGFADLMFYRTALGIGEAMQQAVLFAVVSSVFYKKRAMVMGIINEGFGLGGSVGPYLATKMLLATNTWRTPFVVYFAVTLFMALVVWVMVPKTFTESKGPVQKKAEAVQVAPNVPSKFWNHNSVLCTLFLPFFGLMVFGYLGLYPTFLIKELKFAPMVAASCFSCYGIGAAWGILGGWLGDRISTRWVIVGAYAGVIVTQFLLFNGATQPWQHQLLSFCEGFFASSTLHPNCVALMQKSVRPDMIGRATGLFQLCFYTGGALGGFLLGLLVSHLGWHVGSLIQQVMAPVICLFAVLLIKNDQLYIPATR
jgi:MFS family permease